MRQQDIKRIKRSIKDLTSAINHLKEVWWIYVEPQQDIQLRNTRDKIAGAIKDLEDLIQLKPSNQ